MIRGECVRKIRDFGGARGATQQEDLQEILLP